MVFLQPDAPCSLELTPELFPESTILWTSFLGTTSTGRFWSTSLLFILCLLILLPIFLLQYLLKCKGMCKAMGFYLKASLTFGANPRQRSRRPHTQFFKSIHVINVVEKNIKTVSSNPDRANVIIIRFCNRSRKCNFFSIFYHSYNTSPRVKVRIHIKTFDMLWYRNLHISNNFC